MHRHRGCPEAFESCGWEGRDLIEALEARWIQVGEDAVERELGLVGR